MHEQQADGDLSTGRPIEGQQALRGAQSRAVGPATRLRLVPPIDENDRRRTRVEHALVAGELTMRSERRGTTHMLAVFGELDVATAQRVEDELRLVEATDAEHVILDLAGLTFMDSSGVHLTTRADERCTTGAGRVRLLPGPPEIQRVFTLAATGAQPLPHVGPDAGQLR